MFRRTFSAALLALATLGGAAAGAKDALVIGVAQAPSSLHPALNPETVRVYATAFALRPITAYDKDRHNTCLLCEEVPTLENGLARFEAGPGGARGMAVTIKLRPGLKWGDGEPVTARDVAFTWKLGADPASGFSNPHPWSRASRVDVVDDRTAVLHLRQVEATYASWDEILPEHAEAAAVGTAANLSAYAKATGYNAAPTTPGLWNGPYLPTSYQADQQIVFEPNPNWPGAKPAFKRITLKFVESTDALQSALLAGEVDVAPPGGIGLTVDQVLALRKQWPDRFAYPIRPSLSYEHIVLQRDNPALADVRVRRALLMALDREMMAKRLFDGVQPVANTSVGPLDPNHDPSVEGVGSDTAGARALLAEAGWRPGSDGICRDKSGAKLSFALATTAGNRLREMEAQALQAQWRAACAEVAIKPEPAATLFGETLRRRSYPAMALFAWTDTPGNPPRLTLASEGIPTAANGWAGANYAGFSDRRMDAAIADAEGALDPAKQKAAWGVIQHLYAEQLPELPLFFGAEAGALPTWLTGYAATGHADPAPLWAEEWRSS